MFSIPSMRWKTSILTQSKKSKAKKIKKNILTILLIRTIVWLLVGEQILFQVGESSQLSKTSTISREKIHV